MGLFNKMIYGNPNKPDLEVDENPHPIKSFFEVIRIKIWDLVKLNLLFALFMIPTVLWSYINIQVISEVLTSFQPEGEVVNLFAQSGALYYTGIFLLGLIPCFMIAGIALPSLNYITRSYAREFHVWMMEDFGEKIKENWKQSLLYTFILGVFIFLMFVVINLYTIYAESIPGARIFQGIIYALLAFVMVSTTFVFPLIVTFELKLKQIIKNAMLLTLAKLPQTLLILLIAGILPIFFIWLSMVWGYGTIALLAYFLLFGFSLPAFIMNAFTNQVFGKIIDANEGDGVQRKPEKERKESL